MPILQVRDLRLRRGAREILAGVSFDVDAGDVVALMGLSGAGKPTVLRAGAGLQRYDSGSIVIPSAEVRTGSVTAWHGRERRRGMVFQFHYLFEHLSALDN